MRWWILFFPILLSNIVSAGCQLSDWKITPGATSKAFIMSSQKSSFAIPYHGIRPQLLGLLDAVPESNICVLLYLSSSIGTNRMTEEVRAMVIDVGEAKLLGIVLNEIRSFPATSMVRKAQWTWSHKKVEILEPGKKQKISFSFHGANL
jgi:hypothetical protein